MSMKKEKKVRVKGVLSDYKEERQARQKGRGEMGKKHNYIKRFYQLSL